MPDYQQGKIYKIICKETGEIYIGSTVRPLKQRKNCHTCKGTGLIIQKTPLIFIVNMKAKKHIKNTIKYT